MVFAPPRFCYAVEMITSATNPRLKDLRKLLREGGDAEMFAVEGVRALEEAVRAGVRVITVFHSPKLEATPRGLTLLETLAARGAETVSAGTSALDKTSATETSQGVIACIAKPEWSWESLTQRRRPLFILDALRDPGNVGTIFRIADAFDFGGLVLTDGTVDPFNDKVVRSAMGSLFRIPFVSATLDEAVTRLQPLGYEVFRAEMSGELEAGNISNTAPMALVLGNEAHGARPVTEALVPETLRISMPGQVESLNVAVSAGILAYALTRPRST